MRGRLEQSLFLMIRLSNRNVVCWWWPVKIKSSKYSDSVFVCVRFHGRRGGRALFYFFTLLIDQQFRSVIKQGEKSVGRRFHREGPMLLQVEHINSGGNSGGNGDDHNDDDDDLVPRDFIYSRPRCFFFCWHPNASPDSMSKSTLLCKSQIHVFRSSSSLSLSLFFSLPLSLSLSLCKVNRSYSRGSLDIWHSLDWRCDATRTNQTSFSLNKGKQSWSWRHGYDG